MRRELEAVERPAQARKVETEDAGAELKMLASNVAQVKKEWLSCILAVNTLSARRAFVKGLEHECVEEAEKRQRSVTKRHKPHQAARRKLTECELLLQSMQSKLGGVSSKLKKWRVTAKE